MKIKLLLFLCTYSINAASQSNNDFCKSIKAIADMALQNRLPFLKTGKSKSEYNRLDSLFSS